MGSLAGKVAIVTGGGGGIGRAISLELASQGAAIAVADISLELARATVDAVMAAGGKAVAVAANVGDDASLRAMIAQTVAQLGRLDILVNNANETRPEMMQRDVAGFEVTEPDVFDAYMAAGPKAVLFATKYAVPEMRKVGGGAIVNIASVAGLKGGTTQIAYGACKAATLNLTKKAATAFGKEGIRVNAVSPGLIVHPRLLERWPALGQSKTDNILLSYFGEPEDIANAVGFLASDKAKYITGHNLVVDGGGMVGATYGGKDADAEK